MGRIYTAGFQDKQFTVTNGNYDIFSLDPADDKPCKILAVYLGQYTLEKDANEDQLRILLLKGATTTGSGGAAITPVPHNVTDTAASAVVRCNDSTPCSGGTAKLLLPWTWNVRSEWLYLPPPEQIHLIKEEDGFFQVKLDAAVSADLYMNGALVFEEV